MKIKFLSDCSVLNGKKEIIERHYVDEVIDTNSASALHWIRKDKAVPVSEEAEDDIGETDSAGEEETLAVAPPPAGTKTGRRSRRGRK